MPKKSARPESAHPQIDKFRDLARQLGADEDPEAFKEKVRKVATSPRPAPRQPDKD